MASMVTYDLSLPSFQKIHYYTSHAPIVDPSVIKHSVRVRVDRNGTDRVPQSATQHDPLTDVKPLYRSSCHVRPSVHQPSMPVVPLTKGFAHFSSSSLLHLAEQYAPTKQNNLDTIITNPVIKQKNVGFYLSLFSTRHITARAHEKANKRGRNI